MNNEPTKLQVKSGNEARDVVQQVPGSTWRPFDALRREINQLFEDFGVRSASGQVLRPDFEMEPFWQRDWSFAANPAVDIVEKNSEFEITADLPGLDEKNVEVKVANSALVIKGEKKEEKEENQKDYYVKERRFGSFERSFRIPEQVATDKIEAQFKKGVLTVTLPKKAEAQQPAQTIQVKAA
jgi:HSP20 family protein